MLARHPHPLTLGQRIALLAYRFMMKLFADRLRGLGSVDFEYKVYPEEKHGFFNMSWRPQYAVLRRDLLQFLEAH